MKLKKLMAVLLTVAMVASMCTSIASAAEAEGSELEIITKGSFATEAAAPRYATVQNENVDGQEIIDDVSWHNGVVYDAEGKWAINGTTITMNTDADGSDTNDFSGLGAAVMNNGTYVEIADSTIETTGVAKLALFTDNGGITVVKNSHLLANGGVIYNGYMSTADQKVMVSPPWVLGLGGNAEEPCDARTTNLMGNYSVAAYVDSYFYAKGWGALSVDSGTNMNMVIVNTDVDVETSGYGAYNIGDSTESYYGSNMDVSTYAIIMTGGEASFQSYTGGQNIDVVQFSGETNEFGHGINGNVVATVSSDKVTAGETVVSEIVSDNFGFMCHANGSSGWNVLKVLDGTKVTTNDAIFLVKKVEADITVDNAVLESGNDVIVQVIDNDDDYVGLDFAATWGEDNGYGHAYGSHMPTFNSTFTEAEGYSNEWIADTAAAAKEDYDTASNWNVNYTMTNTAVEGDLWNSTGYVGSNVATTMNVTLGQGAELTGVISAGAFSHTTKYAEVGNGDWTGAEALGHVTNIANSNGVNLVNVVLTDNAAWKVTADSIVTNLTADSAAITADEAVTITVEGTLTLDGEAVTGTKTVGNVTYVAVEPEVVVEPEPEVVAEPEPVVVPEPVAEPETAAPTTYVVKAGDSLWKIAEELLGSGTLWTKIYEANKDTIKDPNLILIGQVLIIP